VKYNIVVRRLAERDLEEAEDWYDEQQSGLGTEFRGSISDLFERLTDNPGDDRLQCLKNLLGKRRIGSAPPRVSP
jgi:plasmid stabilization system protein ParE